MMCPNCSKAPVTHLLRRHDDQPTVCYCEPCAIDIQQALLDANVGSTVLSLETARQFGSR